MYGNQRIYNLHLKFDFGLHILLKTFLWADVVALVHYPGSTRWFVFLDELLNFLTVPLSIQVYKWLPAIEYLCV